MSLFSRTIMVVFFMLTSTVVWAEMPGADAEALCQYVLKEDPYTKWGFWPDHKGLQEGDAPHAPQHKVYVNSIGLNGKKAPAGFGTIVVKENIGKDNKLKALTVMYKVEGFNPEAGDWFWAKYSPSGSVETSGKVKGCISCHSSAEDNDYIFVHEFEQ